ncbi:MAG: aldo/keto reductase [Planctomycetota bacterium]|nr:aldo/keto reductase [Planctomycetota bacterium]
MFNRRRFLQTLAGLTSGIVLKNAMGQTASTTAPAGAATSPGSAAPKESDALGKLLPQRRLGRTGKWVTMLGLGGAHVGQQNERDAQATIEAAIAGGVRYFDTAEAYNGSEPYYGRFLTPKFREHIFLATKSSAVDAKTAREHLAGSLDRLKTDHLDLWQMHAMKNVADVDARLLNGVLDVFLEARDKGKVRHLGFSGHYHPDTHRHLITLMAERPEALQTCLLPINVIDPRYLSFIDGVLPLLVKHNFGVVAMKSLGSGTFFHPHAFGGAATPTRLVPDRVSVRDAVHFTWSMPVAVMLSGPQKPAEFEEMIGFAREFTGMDEARRKALIEKAADCAGTTLETYKQPHA